MVTHQGMDPGNGSMGMYMKASSRMAISKAMEPSSVKRVDGRSQVNGNRVR